MSDDPNRLLFVISAKGKMTWANYCEALDFLSPSNFGRLRIIDEAANRSGLLQCLVALGHCDAYYEDGKSIITSTPRALCRLPQAGFPVAVLTGSRCLHTKKHLVSSLTACNGAVQIITEPQPGSLGLLPDKILVKSESEAAMVAFSAELDLYYPLIPPAWTLVNWCGSLSEYEATLSYSISRRLNWTRYDFCLNTQTFIRSSSESSIRYSRYLNPTTRLPLHVFFRGDHGAEVDLNWGRYLFLNAMGVSVIAYDERRYRICVPVKMPLPSVVARSICLCSGQPPVYLSRNSLVQGFDCEDWLMFEDVPPQIAIAALSKIGQSPARVEIR